MQSFPSTPPRAFATPAIGEYKVPVVRDDERGIVISAKRAQEEKPTFGFLPNPSEIDSSELSKHLETLKNTIGIASAVIAKKASDVHPHRMPETAFEIYRSHCRQSFRDTVTAIREMKQGAQNGRKAFVDAHLVNPSIAAVIGAHIAALDHVALMSKIAILSADQLAVLLVLRGVVSLPEEVWKEVEVAYVIAANLSGDRSDGVRISAKTPSLNDPAAMGIDETLLAEWTNARFKSFQRRVDRAEEVAISLRNICAVLAAACEKQPQDIWDALFV